VEPSQYHNAVACGSTVQVKTQIFVLRGRPTRYPLVGFAKLQGEVLA